MQSRLKKFTSLSNEPSLKCSFQWNKENSSGTEVSKVVSSCLKSGLFFPLYYFCHEQCSKEPGDWNYQKNNPSALKAAEKAAKMKK